MPTLEFPLAIPLTSHVTLAPAARQNEAANDCSWLSATLADGGEIAFVAVQVIVTFALPDAEVSTVLVAVTVTAAGKGTTTGAVYGAVDVPVDTIVPMVELPPGVSFTLHVTSIEAPSVPVTVAVNTCAPLVGTLGVVGETVTTMFGGGGGGGEELDPTVPAQADSKIAQTQMITRQTIGMQLCVARHATRTRRAKIRLLFSRSLTSRMPSMRQGMCQSGAGRARRAFAARLGRASCT